MGSYIKYTYWLSSEERAEVSRRLCADGVRLKEARSVMCTPLDELTKAAYVVPDVWDRLCGRQGSWYRNSRYRGMELIVTSFPIEGLEVRLNTIIIPSEFVLKRPATPEEMEELVSSEAYQRAKPEEWEKVSEAERLRWERWMRKEGVKASFEEIFLAHRANHANFLSPRFYLQEEGEKVPYSIVPSTHLCSCCLEIFNVIGGEYPKKLVAPCLGAVIFARLPANRYLEVRTPNVLSGEV